MTIHNGRGSKHSTVPEAPAHQRADVPATVRAGPRPGSGTGCPATARPIPGTAILARAKPPHGIRPPVRPRPVVCGSMRGGGEGALCAMCAKNHHSELRRFRGTGEHGSLGRKNTIGMPPSSVGVAVVERFGRGFQTLRRGAEGMEPPWSRKGTLWRAHDGGSPPSGSFQRCVSLPRNSSKVNGMAP